MEKAELKSLIDSIPARDILSNDYLISTLFYSSGFNFRIKNDTICVFLNGKQIVEKINPQRQDLLKFIKLYCVVKFRALKLMTYPRPEQWKYEYSHLIKVLVGLNVL